MNESRRQDGTLPRTRFRLATGIEVLDDWSATATKAATDVVHEALFAMLDDTLFRTYRIIDDYQRPNELFVIVRDDLVIKLRINSFDSFDIVHIGPPAESAGFRGRTR